MATPTWILFEDTCQYQIGCTATEGLSWETVPHAAAATPADMAAVLAEKFRLLGYRGEGVLWAVPSSRCLAASFTLASAADAARRQSLAYEFEPCLPLAAEELVIDFVVEGADVLGVAVPWAAEKPWIDALEAQGICLESFVPAALLAIVHEVAPPIRPQLVLWRQGATIDWITLSATGRPRAWRLLSADLATLLRHLRVETWERETPLAVVAHDLPPEMLEALAAVPGVELTSHDEKSLRDAAANVAPRVLADQTPAWIELRRDQFGPPDPYRAVRGPLRWATIAAMALAVALIGGWSYRAVRYDQWASAQQERQQAVFGEVFPGQTTPQGIRSRLESEHAKLAGLQGHAGPLPAQGSALAVLFDVLSALPDGLRYRFQELRFDRQRVFLDGEVLSHGDADQIASALRRRGFQVQAPRTQQLAGRGVSIRLQAELAQKTPNKTTSGAGSRTGW